MENLALCLDFTTSTSSLSSWDIIYGGASGILGKDVLPSTAEIFLALRSSHTLQLVNTQYKHKYLSETLLLVVYNHT